MRKDRFELKRLYEEEGYSCTQIATMVGITRQAAHETLTRVGTEFRKNKLLPFILYDGRKWTVSKTSGYYRDTVSRKKHISLHRYVWEKHFGVIPENYDIHHKDENKSNNDISNLECILKSEHTRLHQIKRNENK
jgi:predicted DNA-binding protein YlxM (UPF0122 family)